MRSQTCLSRQHIVLNRKVGEAQCFAHFSLDASVRILLRMPASSNG